MVNIEGHGARTMLDDIRVHSNTNAQVPFFVSREFLLVSGIFSEWSTLNLIHAACTFWSVGLKKHNNNR